MTETTDATRVAGADPLTGAAGLDTAFDAVALDDLRRRRSWKWLRYPADVLPAWVAEMDVPVAEPVRAALRAAVDLGDLGYADAGDLPRAYADFAAARLGWPVDPAQVRLVPDVMVGVAEILRTSTAPVDSVVINPPVYPPFFDTLAEVGRPIVEIPLVRTATGWGLDLDGLERAFRAGARVYLLCSPHNPTGTVWSRADLTRIAELADRYGVLVLADEIHAPLTLAGARHVPFLSTGDAAAAHSVVLTSASKAWNLAGLKCAVAISASDRMRTALDRLPEAVQYRTGNLGVLAAVAAFRGGGVWLDALLAHLDRNRRLLVDLLAESLPEVGYLPPQASFLAWLDCSALALGDDPAAAFLERGRVALSRGPDFGRQGAGFARLNIGTSEALLTEAVRRMAAVRRR
jgi:cystathionine beta-lyase